jgi:hypothetical protein
MALGGDHEEHPAVEALGETRELQYEPGNVKRCCVAGKWARLRPALTDGTEM